MCSVRTKRSEASQLAGVLTSLIQLEYECVQVIVFNWGDDLMGFFFQCYLSTFGVAHFDPLHSQPVSL